MATARGVVRLLATFLYLLWPVSLLSAENSPVTTYSWLHAMPWPGLWWVFPLLFFLMMIAMFIFFMRGGGPWFMSRRMMDWPDEREARRVGYEDRSESALEILNKRYARGEVGAEEYEETRAAITRPD